MEPNCQEQILNDVVRVDLVLASECSLPVPFQVSQTKMQIPDLSHWTPQTPISALGASKLSVSYNADDADDGMMENAPKLKQATKTTMSGAVVTHDLQVPISLGFEDTEMAASLLHRQDFYVILSTESGARYLLYALPNGSEVLLEQAEVRQGGTLKITVKSASYAILLY